MISLLAEKRFLRHLEPISAYTSVRQTEDAGRSVVAERQINPGQLLGVYPGHRLSIDEFAQKEEVQLQSVKACFKTMKGEILDPTDIFGYVPNKPNNRLALVNEPPPGVQINVLPIVSKRHVWYLCIKRIEAGEHIYTTYGGDYERDYDTDTIKFEADEIECLHAAAKRYIWLRKDINTLLTQFELDS